MKRTLLRLLVFKLAGLCMVGTCWAQEHSVLQFAHAIAQAEGYYRAGTIPNRCSNPGDLKVRGERYPGQVGVCKGGHVRFRNAAAGWAALYHQIDKALAGDSKFYRQDMTLAQVAKKYAANSRLWARNVARNLGVTPSTTLEEYFDLPPNVRTPARAPLPRMWEMSELSTPVLQSN